MAIDKKASDYKNKVEEMLVHYINNGHFTLSKAHEYMTSLVQTIFGNDEHSGLYEFIQKNYTDLKLDDAEILKRSEKMFENGWRVKKQDGRFWLLDENLKAVRDVTGPQTILEPEEEKDSIVINQETSYLFITTSSRAKLVKALKPYNIDPKELKSAQFAYNFVYDKTGGADSELFGLVQSYKALSKILAKVSYFPYVKNMTEITQLYDDGIRLSSNRVNPTSFTRAYMESKSKKFILTPVRPAKIGEYHQDQLALMYAYKKKEALSELGIDVEIPTQIGEKDQTFALLFTDPEDYRDVQDLGEIVRILTALNYSYRSKAYPASNYKKLISNISALAVIESMLFGNGRFSLADLTIDTVHGNVKLRYTGKVSTHTPDDIIMFLNSFKAVSKDMDIIEALLGRMSLRDPKFKESFSVILKNLPDNFENIINNIDLSDLPKGYSQVKSVLLKVIGELK